MDVPADAAGRCKTTTHPDSGITTNTYDATGQLSATTDARAESTCSKKLRMNLLASIANDSENGL